MCLCLVFMFVSGCILMLLKCDYGNCWVMCIVVLWLGVLIRLKLVSSLWVLVKGLLVICDWFWCM